MKRCFLMLFLAMPLVFGGCGTESNQPTEEQPKTVEEMLETVDTWGGKKVSEETQSLVADVLDSILAENYAGKRYYTEHRFDVMEVSESDNELAIAFDLDMAYHTLIEGENPAVLLSVGEEEYHENTSLGLIVAGEESGGIFLDDKEMQHRSIEELLPDFMLEGGTITGQIKLHDLYDGNIDIYRKFWVNETHGLTSNGYLLLDSYMAYGFDIPEDCSISYYKTSSEVISGTREELCALPDLEERIFDITCENGEIIYIVERYRP